MKITVGPVYGISSSQNELPKGAARSCQAKLLNMRRPRSRGNPGINTPPNRRKKSAADPPGARILTILIQDASRIPKDIASGDYTISVKFIPKKHR